MANEGPKPPGEPPAGGGDETGGFEDREPGRGLGDFVRRAVSVGVGAAQRGKEDIMRAAGAEMRTWLERLNVHDELVKVLSKMSVEVKAEIRFKPRDEKTPAPAVTSSVTVTSGATPPAPAGGTSGYAAAVPEPVSDPGSKPERGS